MNNSLEQIIGALNLAIDQELLTEIQETVCQMESQHLGFEIKELQVIAIAALVAQNKRLLAVDNQTLVSAGLSIQSFMSRVSSQNREFLLQLVQIFSLKWHPCTVPVKSKIKTLKSFYSLFLNYQEIFFKFAMLAQFSTSLTLSLLGVFWLAYIQKGSGVKTVQDQSEQQRKMLKWYVGWLFRSFLKVLNLLEMLQVSELQNSSFISKIQQIKLYELRSQVVTNLHNICQIKNLKTDSLHQQLKDEHFAELFLKDYGQIFTQKHESTDQLAIKHTQFFNVNRLLTPRPKPRTIPNTEHVQSISQRLHFKDSDDEEQQAVYWRLSEEATPSDSNSQNDQEIVVEKEPKKELNYNLKDQLLAESNVQMKGQDRLNALSWINKISSFKKNDQQKSQIFFREIFGQNWDEFIRINEKLLQKFITKVSSQCVQVQNKSKKALAIFQHFFATILEKNKEQQIKNMFESTLNLKGFIFISTMITACTYKLKMGPLSICLKQFGINAEEAFIPINWIGTNIELPYILKNYIFQVEKSLLLRQIWIEGAGLKLLVGVKQNKVTYLQSSMMKRLKKHAQNITKQICQENQQLFKSLFEMIAKVENKSANTFQYNTLESVIIAVFALVKGRSNLEQAITIIQKYWKKMRHYFTSSLCYFDQLGNKLPIQIFLKQLLRITNAKQNSEEVVQKDKRKETFFVLGQDTRLYIEEEKS